MSTSTTTGAAPAGRRGRTIAMTIAIGGVLALGGLIGVRVKDTLISRAALAATPVPSAGAERAMAPVAKALVRGVVGTWRPVVPVTGTLGPIQMADVGFKVGGRLRSVAVKEGDVVKLGQRLATLDVTEASAQASAARAGVKSATIGLELAKDGLTRADSLFATKSLSDADHLGATQKVELAKADLERAKAQAELASIMVGNGGLAAPFAGLVTRVPAGIGRIVAPGEPLFHIEDTSVLKLSASVSEVDAPLVETKAELLLDAPATAKGLVTAVLHSLDPQTRRVPVFAEIVNDPRAPLLSGGFVRASIRATREVPVLKLPATALRPGSQDEIVTVRDGKAHLTRVLYSPGEAGALLVRDGLAPTDDVVAAPSPEVREGDPVGNAGR